MVIFGRGVLDLNKAITLDLGHSIHRAPSSSGYQFKRPGFCFSQPASEGKTVFMTVT